ncbi:3-dehydroquinate synthase [Sporolactobacillus sp. CQH2019]|uniref:3-dehydroquinate synthase n=1 Tax=Sporolactobacillus sp. CQH2019 TaxID=3023512 RepID=UPI00236794EC|nr:3-dehydroquinate synthase [Sporolactobacillus sp. CQH2019]MDD9148661.1 3-dehydroquinate synthase [Sporolactobacillus sp. CQH2019]
MEKLMIGTKTGRYPIFVGRGLLTKADELIKDVYSACYIVTDSHVAPMYLNKLEQTLRNRKVFHYIVEAGEQSKNLSEYHRIITDMLEKKLDRNAGVIALGGGVVGDLAGFVAATYLRGVAFLQMPTTLLAHDSSVGGKVGIDHALGKNLIGAFYPPAAVIYDTATLETLPFRELQSGFAELIKHSLISSPDFYQELKEAIPGRSELTPASAGAFLIRGISVKAGIVELDEHESGPRQFLNFGHTLGHALEKELGFGVLTHGEGVAVGSLFALKLSEAYYGCSLPVKDITDWYTELGLPTKVPDGPTADGLIEQMKYDKKNRNGHYHFVLLKSIGKPETKPVPEKLVREMLLSFMND